MASQKNGTPCPSEFIIVLMTAPDADVAGVIARTLIDERLVACVNLLPGLRSLYRWQGKVCDEAEVLCLMKTRRDSFAGLRERIAALHPYEVPEIIALPLVAGNTPYLEWVRQATAEPDAQSK